jgi:hypothetical protein
MILIKTGLTESLGCIKAQSVNRMHSDNKKQSEERAALFAAGDAWSETIANTHRSKSGRRNWGTEKVNRKIDPQV